MDALEEWEDPKPEPTPPAETNNTGLMIFSVLLIGAGVPLILHAEEMAPAYEMRSALGRILRGHVDNPI